MAHFRGLVQGGRSAATRLGHKTTGLTVEAQTWAGKVTTRVWHDAETDCDRYEVTQDSHEGGYWDRKVLAHGVVGA